MTHNTTRILPIALSFTNITVTEIQNSELSRKDFVNKFCQENKCIDWMLMDTNPLGFTKQNLQAYFHNAIHGELDTEESLNLIRAFAQTRAFMDGLSNITFLDYVVTLTKHANLNASNALKILLHFNPQRITNELLTEVLKQVDAVPTAVVRLPRSGAYVAASETATVSMAANKLKQLFSIENIEAAFKDVSTMDHETLKQVLIQDTDRVVLNKIIGYLSTLNTVETLKAIASLKSKLYLLLVTPEAWNIFHSKLEELFKDKKLADNAETIVRIIKELSAVSDSAVFQLLSTYLRTYFNNHETDINAEATLSLQLNKIFAGLITYGDLQGVKFLFQLMPLKFLTKNSIDKLGNFPNRGCVLTPETAGKYQEYLKIHGLTPYAVSTQVNVNGDATKTNTCGDIDQVAQQGLLKTCENISEKDIPAQTAPAISTTVPPITITNTPTSPAEVRTHGDDAAPKAPGFSKSDTKPKAAAKSYIPSKDASKQDNMCAKLIAGCQGISSLFGFGGIAARLAHASTTAKSLRQLSAGLNSACVLTVTAPCRLWFNDISNSVALTHALGVGLQLIPLYLDDVISTLSSSPAQPPRLDTAPLEQSFAALDQAKAPTIAAVQKVGTTITKAIRTAENVGVPSTQANGALLHTVNAAQFLQPVTQAATTALNSVQGVWDTIDNTARHMPQVVNDARALSLDCIQRHTNSAKAIHALSNILGLTELVAVVGNSCAAYGTFPGFTQNTTLGEAADDSGQL